METYGDRIRKRRIELGLSQEDLEDLCQASRSTISKAENDKQYPKSIVILGKMANVLKVNLYYVLPPEVMEMMEENPSDQAYRKFCEPLNSEEKIQKMSQIIESVEGYLRKK